MTQYDTNHAPTVLPAVVSPPEVKAALETGVHIAGVRATPTPDKNNKSEGFFQKKSTIAIGVALMIVIIAVVIALIVVHQRRKRRGGAVNTDGQWRRVAKSRGSRFTTTKKFTNLSTYGESEMELTSERSVLLKRKRYF